MKKPLLSSIFLLIFASCQAQNETKSKSVIPVGGGCDGCELMYLGMPDTIAAADTSVGWTGATQKLIVNGTVFETDGRTPAAEVIVYYWHTDEAGFYAKKENKPVGDAARHGARRGWTKTGSDGHYSIYTNRPAAYPNRDSPAHIHLAIKEPAITDEYYVDELVFDDDPLLTAAKRKALENRGGSGILRPEQQAGVQVARHDVILGLHIPHYPGKKK